MPTLSQIAGTAAPAAASAPVLRDITPPERSRTYTFARGERITIAGVTRLGVSDSGTHRLETADGKKHIVPRGWMHIEIDTDGWAF